MRNLALFLVAVNLLLAAWFYLLQQEAVVSRQPPPLPVGAELVLRSELPDYARGDPDNEAEIDEAGGSVEDEPEPVEATFDGTLQPEVASSDPIELEGVGPDIPDALTCIAIGPFDTAELAQTFGLQRQIESARIAEVLRSRTSNWQIVVEASDTPVEELRARLGFEGFDSFPTELEGRPAVRLGVFGIESNADRLVGELAAKGFAAGKVPNRVAYTEYWLQLDGASGALPEATTGVDSGLEQKTCAEVASPDNIQ